MTNEWMIEIYNFTLQIYFFWLVLFIKRISDDS